MLDLMLIYPPVVRPSEPPLGLAVLAAFLRKAGLSFQVLDLNVETFQRLLAPDFPNPKPLDRFSRRSLSKLQQCMEEIRSPRILSSLERYRSVISHLQRVLWLRTQLAGGPRFTLTDFQHPDLSPLRTQDLHRMAQERSMGPIGVWMEQRLLDTVHSLRPRWIGISVQYLSQALSAMALAGALHRATPHVKVVMGGGLVTSWARLGTLPDLRPWVDELIPGSGLEPLARLLGRHPESLPGDLPVPQFQGFPLDQYLSPERIVPMNTSVGCYWGRCQFCPEADQGSSFREIPAGEVPPRMEETALQSAARWLHLTDNAIPPQTLKILARSEIGIPWFGFARFEPLLAEPELARGLYRSGCRMLQLGLESGSQRVLARLKKGIRLQVASEVLRALHQQGIATYVYVLFGTPGETMEDAKSTMRFVVDHAPWIDYLHCAILNLPRAGLVSRNLDVREFPGQGHQDLSLYVDFRASGGMDRRAARRFLEREFSRQPEIAAILRRDPPSFTSAHAALFARTRSSLETSGPEFFP